MWWLGAIMGFLATACSTIGVNMQKMSANEESKHSPSERRSYFRQRIWAQGMLLCVVGAFTDFGALALTAQSVIAPIKSSALVINLTVAYLYLGETLTKWDFVGSLFIIIGSLLSVFFGNQDSKELDSDDIKILFLQLPIVIYALTFIVFIIFCFIYSRRIEKLRTDVESFFEELYVDPSETLKMLSTLQESMDYQNALAAYSPYMKTHSSLYCALAGAIGGQSLVFVKCVSMLFRTTIEGDNQFGLPWIYLYTFCMLSNIVGQVHYLNKALIISDAMFVVPIYQCFYVSFSTIGGLIFYQEYATWTAINWIFCSAGLVAILVGVRTLAMRNFDDMEIQFVSTCNVLHGSTFEMDKPLVSDEESSVSSVSRRTSVSIRMGPSGSGHNKPTITGGVFSELPAVTASPFARELVQLGKRINRISVVSSSSTAQTGDSMQLNLGSRKGSTTDWKIIHEDASLSLQNAKRKIDMLTKTVEKLKAEAVWEQEMDRIRRGLDAPEVITDNRVRVTPSGSFDGYSSTSEDSSNFRNWSLDTDHMDHSLPPDRAYSYQPTSYYSQPNFYATPPTYYSSYTVPVYPYYAQDYSYYYPPPNRHVRIASYQPHLQFTNIKRRRQIKRKRRRKRQPERRHRSLGHQLVKRRRTRHRRRRKEIFE